MKWSLFVWSHKQRYHYRTQLFCRVLQALGKSQKTLDKDFDECSSRQRGLGKLYIGNSFFAKNFLLGTRQSLCRVSRDTRQEKSPSRRQVTVMEPLLSVTSNTRQRSPLCRVPTGPTLSKEGYSVGPLPVPLTRAPGGTHQTSPLCRVPVT
jgi:hypothetical protein